jgi:transposase
MASHQEWSQRVAAWRSSGQTARNFCAEHGYAASSLYLWASKLEREPNGRPVRLARVVREPSQVPREGIVIELGALRVHLPARADATVVEHALRTLADVSAS